MNPQHCVYCDLPLSPTWINQIPVCCCDACRNKKVEENLGLVYWAVDHIRKKHSITRRVTLEDSVQVGMLTLLKVVAVHVPSRSKLSSHYYTSLCFNLWKETQRASLIAEPVGKPTETPEDAPHKKPMHPIHDQYDLEETKKYRQLQQKKKVREEKEDQLLHLLKYARKEEQMAILQTLHRTHQEVANAQGVSRQFISKLCQLGIRRIRVRLGVGREDSLRCKTQLRGQ